MNSPFRKEIVDAYMQVLSFVNKFTTQDSIHALDFIIHNLNQTKQCYELILAGNKIKWQLEDKGLA